MIVQISLSRAEMTQMRGGYHIICNVLDVHVPLPVDITPTLRISKADDAQIDTIQRLLKQTNGGFPNLRMYYENHWVETKESETSSQSTPHALERKDWRYYVVAYSEPGTEAHKFLRAANLSRPAPSICSME